MLRRRLKLWFICLGMCVLATPSSSGQVTNQVQRFSFAGLHDAGSDAQFQSVASEPGGTLLLLEDDGDGIRLIRVGATNHELVSGNLLGAAGDHGNVLTLGPAGEIYVAGTLSSGSLSATAGAAMQQQSSSGPSTFVARLDNALQLQWLSYTGASRSSVTAISANASGVFVAGFLYGADVPVTANAVQRSPASGSTENGFLEDFSTNGSRLTYATYLTGSGGDTSANGIVVDAGSDAWIVGATTASGFPTKGAIVPTIEGSSSGFALQVTPAGDSFVWSTFVPGNGLSAIALDSSGSSLLITGNVDPGQFPVDTVEFPLVPGLQQVLLRLSLDGSSVKSGTVVAAATQSTVSATSDGGAWVTGFALTTSVPTSAFQTLATTGNGFSVHINGSGKTDQTVRFGGLPTSNLAFASVPIQVNATTISALGRLVIAGSVNPTASSSLLGSETYDLPLNASTSSSFGSTIQAAEGVGSACSGSLCAVSAGYLAEIDTADAGPSLLLANDDAPMLRLRNLGTSSADGLNVAGSNPPVRTNCGSALASGAECGILVPDTSAGTINVSANGTNVTTLSYAGPLSSASEENIFFYPREIDFGIRNGSAGYTPRSLTIVNLQPDPVTLASASSLSTRQVSPFSLYASDCASTTPGTITLAAGSSCHLSFVFSAWPTSAQDGPYTLAWNLGSHQALLTGYSMAESLSASSQKVNFGTVISGTAARPRYLFLANQSAGSLNHAQVALPPSSAFSVTDECPSEIQAGAVCRLTFLYASAVTPSIDDANLFVDGLDIEITGSTVQTSTSASGNANPYLVVTPQTENFSDPVVLTGVSATTQTVAVSNSGTSSFPLSVTLTGDFSSSSSCMASINPGSSCAIAITFTPSQPGTRRGLLSISSGSNFDPQLIPLSGTGLSILSENNGLLSLGTSPVGQPLVQYFKVSQTFLNLNFKTQGPYRAMLVEDTGAGHGSPPISSFVANGSGTCYNCWLAVSFQPTAAGTQSGTLTLGSDARGLPYTIDLSGTGTATTGVVLTPAAKDFGSIAVHSSSGTSLFTVTNLGDPTTILTVSPPSGQGDFVITPAPPPYAACGGLLAFGAECSFQISFAPTNTGARASNLVIATSSGDVTGQLTGTGTPDSGVGISPEALQFANVSGPSATQQSFTITNTGSITLTVGSPQTTVRSFAATTDCATLLPQATCTVFVTFSPGQAEVTGAVTFSVTQQGQQPHIYSVALSGAYTVSQIGLLIAPALAEFGPTATEIAGASRQFSVFNATAQPLSLALSVPRQFSLTVPPCGVLAPAARCSFTLLSVPMTHGDIPGTLTLEGMPADGTAPLSNVAYAESFGIGSGAISISGGQLANGSFSFGEVTSGQIAMQTFVITNVSGASQPAVTIRRVRSQSPFTSTTTCGTALPPRGTCQVVVTYSPLNQVATGSGSAAFTPDAGTLTIESDAPSSPDVINLSGLAGPVSVSTPTNTRPIVDYTLSQQSMTFDNIMVGDATLSQGAVLTNTGNSPMHILSTNVSSEFDLASTCGALGPGESCSLTVRSKPITSGSHIGAVQIATDASQSLEFISLFSSADPSPLLFSSSALNFGSVELGKSASLPLGVTNTGSVPIVFQRLSSTLDYSVSGTCPPAGQALSAQSSCALQVTFAPSAMGARSGSLSFVTSASTYPLLVTLAGLGTGPTLEATPSSVDFGTIGLGATASQTLTITNNGTAPAAALQSMISGDFKVISPCSQPTLQVGAQCAVTLTFSPTSLGAATGAFSLQSTSSALVVPLMGTGSSNGGFTLTVDGGSSSSVSIVQGDFATYTLRLDPQGGYTGSVALSCLPLAPALFANCTLSPSVISLAGGSQQALASINTITIGFGVFAEDSFRRRMRTGWSAGLALAVIGLGLLPGKNKCGRHKHRRVHPIIVALLASCLISGGCGSGDSLNAHFTPTGTYEFQVVANSTSGTQVSHAVTLKLVVMSR